MSEHVASQPQPENALREAAYHEASQYRLPPGWDEGRDEVHGLAIDNPTTCDRDDAIALSKQSDGTHLVQVSIADIASFLPQLPATWAYAKQQGETRYLRTSNIPMMPPAISESLLSLHDDAPRPALTVEIPVHPDGEAGRATFRFTKIQAINTTYAAVNKAVEEHGKTEGSQLMHAYADFAHLLLEARRRNGAFAFYRPQQGVMSGMDGELVKFHPGTSHAARLIVQEFMILANIATAEYAAHHDIPIVYRNHTLRQNAPKDLLQKLCDQEEIDQSKLGRVYERARYSATLIGHAALNLDAYCHSTSVLRRGADVVTQANIRAHLLGQELPFPRETAEELAQHFNAVQDQVRGSLPFRAIQAGSKLAAAKNVRPQAVENPGTKILPEKFQEYLKTRLTEQKLTVTDLETLTGALKGGSLDQELAAQLVDHLRQNPPLATAALHQALAKGHLAEFSVKTSAAAVGFAAEASAAFDEDRVFFGRAHSPGKKEAAQHGAIAVVARMLGLEEPEQSVVVPEIVAIDPQDLQPFVVDGGQINPKNNLQETLAKQNLARPTYNTQRVGGTDTQPVFESTISVTIGGQRMTATTRGVSKTDAEMKAAHQVLPQVLSLKRQSKGALLSELAEGPVDPETVLAAYQRPTEVLGDFCRENGLEPPRYQIGARKGGKGFWCTVEATTPSGEAIHFEVEDSSKKKVRQRAAATLLASELFRQKKTS